MCSVVAKLKVNGPPKSQQCEVKFFPRNAVSLNVRAKFLSLCVEQAFANLVVCPNKVVHISFQMSIAGG